MSCDGENNNEQSTLTTGQIQTEIDKFEYPKTNSNNEINIKLLSHSQSQDTKIPLNHQYNDLIDISTNTLNSSSSISSKSPSDILSQSIIIDINDISNESSKTSI